jgi:hypothetical protein
VFVDRAANLFIADWGNHRIRRVDGATGIITTVAGTGEGGLSGDGGPATHGRLDRPTDTFVDEAGNIYIADNGNRRIRRVDAVTGIITTMAGTTEGFSGDGGPATEARLSTLSGLSVDREGNLFIADSGNHRIRRVDAATGIITTVAGTGEGPPPVIDKPASRTGVDSSGDGGPATQANISVPDAVSVDDAGNLYIADTGNLRIRRVDAVTGIITTVAGTGEIFGPLGDGAPATEASLQDPSGVFVDGSGNLYIADTLNQRIRRVDAVTGVITTVAGTGERGFSGDGGPATRARLDRPVAVFVDGAGDLYFADNWNNRVRKVTIPSTSVADGMTPDQTATAFALAQNYPNPFNPTTRILYQLAQSGPVSLAIYDLLGQRIRILVQEQQVAGAHQVAWDGTDATGHDVAAGIYVYRLATPQGILARRMMRLK